MKKKIILKLSLLALLFLPLSCGFKVLNKSNAYNYSIKEIITSGNKRISYKIKNNLLANSKENSPNELIIYVKAEKSQDIKEKNIVEFVLNDVCNIPPDTVPHDGLAPAPPVTNACPLVPAASFCRPEPSI